MAKISVDSITAKTIRIAKNTFKKKQVKKESATISGLNLHFACQTCLIYIALSFSKHVYSGYGITLKKQYICESSSKRKISKK